jgi:hypothetical protein
MLLLLGERQGLLQACLTLLAVQLIFLGASFLLVLQGLVPGLVPFSQPSSA